MITLHQFSLFFAAALVLAVMPGPGMLYVAARTISGGRSEGLASSFGTAAGGLVHVVAAAVGLSAVILASARLFALMKLAGAVYLIWIGVKTITAVRREPASGAENLAAAAPAGPHRAFRDGMLVEATNPKTAAFFLAFLPQFVVPAQGGLALQFVILGTASVVLNTSADIVVAFSAARLRTLFHKNPGLLRRFRMASGGLFVALGAGMLMARRPAH